MKLSKLYCNDRRFKNIKFNLNGINVIYADVQSKKEDKKNSHDLGKTKFADILDFLLLKKIYNNHFLKRVKENEILVFINHVFYLELYLNSGQYLTIKRAVNNNTKISFLLQEQTTNEFKAPLNWSEENITIDKAKDILSNYLKIDFFHDKDYDYRKSISYSLRRQDDFKDVYKLNKFSMAKDVYWKPFMFDLLGFKGKLLKLKYDNDKKVKEIQDNIDNLKKDLLINIQDRDYFVAEIENKKNEIEEIEKQIDQFNFYKKDKQLIRAGIENIENKISLWNKDSYRLNYEIEKLKSSIKNNFSFDINKVKKIFEETSIYFPKELTIDYQNLMEFNQKLTVERNKLLKQTLLVKEKKLKELNTKLISINKEREDLLSHLTDADTFKKFKYHQKQLAKQEGELSNLKQQLENIDKIIYKQQEISDLENNIASTAKDIKDILNKTETNEKYNEIRTYFTQLYKNVMNEKAVLSLKVNSNGNVDFIPPIVKSNQDNLDTAKDEGNTYKKLLCVVFDIAIMKIYSRESYYRFIYHDDVLSQQDNGVKTRLLKILQNITKETNIQYILSVIKSDLPTNDEDKPIYFSEDKIVLKLHDKDASGTLFGFEF